MDIRPGAERAPIEVALSTAVDPHGPLEAAFVLKRTGVVLAAWTRDEVPADVVSVMAATLAASVGTIAEAFGAPSPESFVVDMGSRELLATRVDANRMVVLLGSKADPEALRRAVERVLSLDVLRGSGGEVATPRIAGREGRPRGSR